MKGWCFFLFFFYALIMYAHVYTLHDVLLLCNTTNLRILSSLRGDSIKRWFTICAYSKSKPKLHSNLARKIKKTAKNTKKKKKIIVIIAKSSKNYSTSWNLWILAHPNVNIQSTARRGNSDLHRWKFVLSVPFKWIHYATYGRHHHDADKKRHQQRKFQHPIINTEPVTSIL